MRGRLIRGIAYAIITFVVVGNLTGKWPESLVAAVIFGVMAAMIRV